MNNKQRKLETILKKMNRALIAFSGGVDSTFLLSTAIKVLGQENVLCVTAVSETYPASELKQAKLLSKNIGARHILIKTSELENNSFKKNPLNRCFFCKDELFKKLTKIAKAEKMILCDATNFSDNKDFRPGRKAAAKWKVISPLLMAKITKQEIRDWSRESGLPTWDMPAQACLASRFPYGTPLSKSDLTRVEKGEIFLKKQGLITFRLRNHGEIARIEVDTLNDEHLIAFSKKAKISSFLRKLGWRYVTIDIDGYRCGSMNP